MKRDGNMTEIGAAIERKLAEKELTRQGFCDMYDIPLFRLNRMARGEKVHRVDYNRILRLLGLNEQKDVILIKGKKCSKLQKSGKIKRTALGWEIKRRLAGLQMTQKAFCEKYGIPTGRMAEIVTGKRLAKAHRRRIVQLLGIDEAEFRSEDDWH